MSWGECARELARVDELIQKFAVGDAQSARIAGYPYLRANRLLSSSLKPAPDTARFDDWVKGLRTLDREARQFEVANLPSTIRGDINPQYLDECAQQLASSDLPDANAQQMLRDAVVTPDAYRLEHRILGLYPLTAIPFELGIRRWQDQLEEMLSVPLAEIPIQGALVRYGPADPGELLTTEQVGQIIERSRANSMGIPYPDPDDMARLFTTFAPIWEVDVSTEDDRIGTPYWPRDANSPAIKTRRCLSLTRCCHIPDLAVRFCCSLILSIGLHPDHAPAHGICWVAP